MFLRNYHGWTGRGYPSRTSSCISSWANSRCNTRGHLTSSRNGARGVALSFCRSWESRGDPCVQDKFLILLCSVSQEMPASAVHDADVPVFVSILCTVLWVPCRVIDTNSMFPTSWIICSDSWLKGLNDWLCCRSRWRTCRCGWFSIFWITIFWINSRTLAPCNCFTVECGSPGMLKSMSSSLISRLNSLSVLNDAMSRFSSGANCSFTVCGLLAVLLHRLSCSIMNLLNSDVFRQFIRFPRSIWRTKFFVQTFFIDLVGTGRLTLDNQHLLHVIRLRTQIGLGFGWNGWENVACWTSPRDCWTSLPTGCWSTVEPSGTFPLVQSWSWRNVIFGGGRGDKYDSSFKTSAVFNLTTFGIQ